MNEGKKFEEDFKKSFSNDNISIDRLYDNTGGYAGVHNICDFIIYKHPFQYYFELKSCQSKSFPLSGLSDNQYEGLLKKSPIYGVTAGVIINFRNTDPKLNKTFFVDINNIFNIKQDGIKKSISLQMAEDFGVPLLGKCKITRWVYDVENFLDDCKHYRRNINGNN